MARELTTDLAVLERMAPPAGKDVLDVGCGRGSLVRDLASRGARMTGLEISEEQLAPALAADDDSGSRYVVGEAQELPLADGSVDLVLFMRSLHHIPAASHQQALREARRVVRGSGAVYVAEPLAEGDFFALTSLVEDELEARRAAQRALQQASAAGLESAGAVEYEVAGRYGDLEAFRDLMLAADPERAPVFEARRSVIERRFAQLGEPMEGGGRRFRQPIRAELLRPVV
jgi:ubiquinone/menaquinone biosynthesis C-methylase UbiE